MFVASDFPAVLQTIDQTFFIEVFWSFNHTSGFGPDDSVIFNIMLSRVFLHPFQSVITETER